MRTLTLTGMFVLATLMLSTVGCVNGSQSPGLDVRQPVLYVPAGWLVPANLPEMLDIPDKTQRDTAIRQSVIAIEHRYLVDIPTMQWLLKQVAKARRLEEEHAK